MAEHSEESTELVKRWFRWANDNGLSPSIKAVRASKRRRPGWRLSVAWGDETSEIAFIDARATVIVNAFADAVARFNPSITAFEG